MQVISNVKMDETILILVNRNRSRTQSENLMMITTLKDAGGGAHVKWAPCNHGIANSSIALCQPLNANQ